MPSKDLIIEIKANTKEALKEIEELKEEIKNFSESVKKGDLNLKESEKTLASFTKRLTDMAHAYVGFSAIKGAVSVVADFEQSIAKLGAISGASKENLEKLKNKAEELGKSTQFSASEVAEGMNYLAMAGYKTKDILASINDVLNLAAVGQVNLAQASDIASNILSGFGMKAEETARVVDVMTATITNANTNIPELGEAMKYVAPQAKALGVSLEETATAIGVLSNAGIKATMAGTGLSTMLLRLASPTGAAAKDLEELGIKVYDANGKFVGLTNVLKQFHEKMKGLSQEAKTKYLQNIFGIETIKTAITLIDSVGNSYDKLYEKIANSTGLTEEKVKQMTDTFNGHLKELENAFQGLIITIGNELLPALTDFVKWLTTATSNITDFYKENKELINTIAKLTATFYALAKIKGVIEAILGAKAVAEIIAATKALKGFTGIIRALGIALMNLTKANAVLLALTAAIYAVNYAFDKWEANIKKMNESANKLQKSTTSLNDIMSELKKHMVIDESGRHTFRLTAEEIQKLKDKTKALIEVNEKRIKQLKEASDGSREYKNMIAALEEQNKTLHLTLKKLSTLKPYENTAKSADNASKKVEKLTKTQQKYLDSLDKRLQKEKQTTKTIEELKNEEIKKAKEILGNTKYFEEAKSKIVEFYALKELHQLKNTYSQRITAHTQTIKQLEQKEKDLTNRILELNKQLMQKLKNIEEQRVAAIESIEDKIHNIIMSDASEYEKYVDKKKQAEILLGKAREAILKGNLHQAKRYMNEYESIVTSIANKEIKENGKVLVSKKQANNWAISALKKLEVLTNGYYAKEKQKAIELHNQKIRQLKAELTATKAQLQLEVQRLKLEKQLIEAVTGKKVEIDASEALESIKKLDTQIKELDKQIKKPKKITADTKEAEAKLKNVDKKVNNTKGKIKVDANTKPALAGILEIKDKITGEKEIIKLYADNREPKTKLNEIKHKADTLKPLVKVKSDINEALNKLKQIPRTITTIHYIKEVHQKASGGLIPRLNTGGFAKISGRIPGFDVLDSDNVPALLTRGEFVIRREAVKYYGDDFLYKLNAMLLPRFATGGLVEVGKVQKISSNSDNFDNLDDYSNSEIIDKLDEMINSLKEYLKTLKGTKNKSEINDLIEKLQKDKKEYANRENDIKSLKDSVKGKVLKEEEYENFTHKLKNKENALKEYEKQVNNDLKIADDLINKLQEYLSEVEKYKDLIRNRISKLGIDESLVLSDNFDYVYDLDRLKSFYEKLSSIELLNKDEVERKYNNYIQEMIKELQSFYYGVGSIFSGETSTHFLDEIRARYSGADFLRRLHINDNNLAVQIPMNYDYRSFGGSYLLPDDLVDKILLEYLKEHLPRFQTGGIVEFSKGGKLAGYGGGDRNLALLEDGEFVIRKEAVRAFGVDLFESLNNLKFPKFQSGGIIGSAKLSTLKSSINYDKIVNVNLTFPDGKSFKMLADEEIAMALSRYSKIYN